MKTTKKLVVLCLALLMCVITIVPSFSWFTHEGANSGNRMYYNRTDLPVSKEGSVSIDTQAYQMDGRDIKLDRQKNKLVEDSMVTSVAAGTIRYYKTTFTNNGTGDSYLSLYLNGINNNVKVKIGSTYPTIHEEPAGKSERSVIPNPAMRIYFEPRDAKGWNGDSMYIHAKPEGGNYPATGIAMTKANGTVKNFTANTATNKNTFYADLPSDSITEEFFISREQTYANCTGFNRTRAFSAFVPQTVYSLTGFTTNDNNLYAAVTSRTEVGAISVPYKLNYVAAAEGDYVYVSLPSSFKGGTASYALSSGASSEAYELNASNGRLKINQQGTGNVVTTVTGDVLGDTMTLETEILFDTEKNNIPLSRNIMVPQGSSVYVEWYIDNGMEQSVSFQTSDIFVVY